MDAEAARAVTETHTHTDTHTQDNYSNPHACAPRVNYKPQKCNNQTMQHAWYSLLTLSQSLSLSVLLVVLVLLKEHKILHRGAQEC